MLSNIQNALEARSSFLASLENTDCVRLFHGAAEGQPGLAVDRYGSVLLLQTWRDPLTELEIEKIQQCVEAALGEDLITVWNHRGQEKGKPREIFPVPDLPARVIGTEHGLRFDVHPRHKVGDPLLFLDSRVARRRLREASAGKTVLNLFSYTCSAGVAAIAGGAKAAWNVDFARTALDVGTGNARLNDIQVEGDAANPTAWRNIHEDVFPVIRQYAGMRIQDHRGGRKLRFKSRKPRQFDIVVLDPPRWSRSAFGAVDVVRDYPTLFKPALLATAPGGHLLCTNHVAQVGFDDWTDVLRRSAAKAGRPIQSLERLQPDADVPSFDGNHPLKIAWIGI
jgi:23S rRNA (cytosine1962-C5)-methyltransferase